MFVLPILSEEMRVPLDDAGLAGVVAVLEPLDVEGVARWHDAFPDVAQTNLKAQAVVRQQLRALEGLAMGAPGAAGGVAFDPANALHFRSIPWPAVLRMYSALLGRTVLTEEQRKNSGSPSASDGTPASEG